MGKLRTAEATCNDITNSGECKLTPGTLLNLPAKCGGAFEALAIPGQKKKDYPGKFSTEFVGSTTRDGAFLSRTYSARLRAAACTTQGLCFVPVDIGFALHRAALHRFAFPSIWPLLYFANSRLAPPLAAFQSSPALRIPPTVSPLSSPASPPLTRALFPDSRYFRIGMKPTGEKDAQRKGRREMKFKEVSIK